MPGTLSSGFIKSISRRHWLLDKPRLCKILSHHDEDSECFSLQFEVESSARLHEWYVKHGEKLLQEMQKVFKDKAVGFTTLMEVIEEH